MIAKTVGVATGSLFTYFTKKNDLLNAVYLYIKQIPVEPVLANLPSDRIFARRLGHLYQAYIDWGLVYLKHRKVLQQLAVFSVIVEHLAIRQGTAPSYGN